MGTYCDTEMIDFEGYGDVDSIDVLLVMEPTKEGAEVDANPVKIKSVCAISEIGDDFIGFFRRMSKPPKDGEEEEDNTDVTPEIVLMVHKDMIRYVVPVRDGLKINSKDGTMEV